MLFIDKYHAVHESKCKISVVTQLYTGGLRNLDVSTFKMISELTYFR